MTRVQRKLYAIIFQSNTLPGKLFDLTLIITIVLSIIILMLESVASIYSEYGPLLHTIEWGITLIFSLEYICRLYCSKAPKKYAFSFFGIIDLVSILPTFIAVIFPGVFFLGSVRLFRVLRVFRILKLAKYIKETDLFLKAFQDSRQRITVFLMAVLVIVSILGSFMYVIEGADAGFTSIPKGIYWAIVTLTTVGYGDIAPQTPIGQTISALVMVLGYGIIAVPTGLVTAELVKPRNSQTPCPHCGHNEHYSYAQFCCYCGQKLS